ncbi:alpha/beta hydrolase [Rhizobacter sp. LjRoot28]|uniref:alpha/beta hydrolase n=1 Tax=Rhizobacter sp. LjRoot28 TaxID=3342309 RepID=UPI003ED106AB
MSAAPDATANPVAAFYGGQRLSRALGRGLATLQCLAPRWAERLAFRLFFTPLPTKQAARRKALPPGWSVDSWAFEAGTMAVYRRQAADTSRPRVLLVHGWAGHALQMHPLAEAVAAAGLEPVLLEFPGHGRAAGWGSTLPQFVRGLWAASARLGPLHAVIGHSMGALAAAHAAAHGLPVARLALVATSPPPQLVLGWFARGFGLDAALAAGLRRLIEQREGLPLEQFEAERLGPRLPAATLLVHDEDDFAAPAALARRLLAHMPGGDWLTTRGLGHRRLLSDSEVLQRVAEHVTRPVALDVSSQ